jgi:uncharacterized OB-fold protein
VKRRYGCALNKPEKLVVNAEAAQADARFLAPELVQLDTNGSPQLIGGRCKACGALSFPRGALCTECLSEDVETTTLGDRGKLYSYSVVHQAPKGWNVPYALGYVDLSDGVRVLAHVGPIDKLAMDLPVKLAVGVVGSDPAGVPLKSYTFVPE